MRSDRDFDHQRQNMEAHCLETPLSQEQRERMVSVAIAEHRMAERREKAIGDMDAAMLHHEAADALDRIMKQWRDRR
jgi:hypothetical protein